MSVSKVDVVVLGLLSEEPLYGYDLLERFRERSMGLWVEIGRASVYQALHRLERDGFISGRDHDGLIAPDRRVYRIARAGRARLRSELLESAGKLGPYESEAGTALGFVGSLSAADARRALDAREAAIRGLLAAIREERKAARRDVPGAAAGAMLDRQESLANAELAWLRNVRPKLKS